jgi:hypothetical protein
MEWSLDKITVRSKAFTLQQFTDRPNNDRRSLGSLELNYQNRNFVIPKIIVVFRTDLHKMKINTELCCKRYHFLTKKTQNYLHRRQCYLSSKIFATSARVWTRSTSLSSFQLIPYIYPAFVPFGRYFTSIHLSL